jgi:ATP-binding cassette subfamily B protein
MRIRTVLFYARPYQYALALAASLMLLESLVALVVPWLAGQFARSLLLPQAVSLNSILVALLLLFALIAALHYVNTRVMGTTALRISSELRVQVYEKLQTLPLAFFQQRSQGDLLALLTHEVDDLGNFISSTLLSIPSLLFTVAGAVLLMFLLDPLLAILVTALVPLFYLLLKVTGRQLRPLAISLQEEYAGSVAILEENLGMLPAIKVFTREASEVERYRHQTAKVFDLGCKQVQIHALLEPALQFASAAAILFLLWLAGERINAQSMTVTELISFLLYAALLTRPVSALAGVYGQIQVARGALARLERLFAEAPEDDMGKGIRLPQVSGEIRFEQVSFCYPARQPVLEDLDLQVRAGETLAIVGANGSGKSTLIHLLLRLYQPQQGRILLDGVDINTLDLRFVREQIALVSQQVLLFNGSIAANIAFAKPHATAQEIKQVATLAQLHDFIDTLPAGYATLIGDRGIRLSGGQCQRLALARALLKSAPILVLDEATAMFDPAGEQALIETCHQVLAPLTVILVTHRPASLALADRVLALRDGKLHAVSASNLQPTEQEFISSMEDFKC